MYIVMNDIFPFDGGNHQSRWRQGAVFAVATKACRPTLPSWSWSLREVGDT